MSYFNLEELKKIEPYSFMMGFLSGIFGLFVCVVIYLIVAGK